MKLFKIVQMVGFLSMASLACGQEEKAQEIKSKPPQKQMQESKEIPVPLPPTTPFGSDPKARAVYLENYQTAYRYFMASLNYQGMDSHCGAEKSLFTAYLQGQKDGISQAVRDQMKDLIFRGSSKDYTKWIATPEGGRVPWINSDTGLYIDSSKAGLNIK